MVSSFSFGSVIRVESDQLMVSSDNPALWQYDGMGNVVNQGANRQQSSMLQGYVTNTELVKMIGSILDKILDNNGLYMHLKVLNAEQATKLSSLRERLAIMEKELGDTKIQCETLSNVVDQFVSEHHDHTCNMGTGRSVVLGDVPPYPPLDPKEDHPAIDLWIKEDFNHAEANHLSGETNGDMPPGNSVPTPEGNHPPHSLYYYLQHHDGTPVSRREVATLSFDACSLWMTLMQENWAPKTFSKMSSSTWEFFSWMLLDNPDHAFLCWCDDRQWKLREWAKQNYSLWMLNIGLRQKKSKKKAGVQKTKTKKDSILNDPDLFHMPDHDNDGDNNGEGSSQSISFNDNHGPSNSDQEGGEGTPPMQILLCTSTLSRPHVPTLTHFSIQGPIVIALAPNPIPPPLSTGSDSSLPTPGPLRTESTEPQGNAPVNHATAEQSTSTTPLILSCNLPSTPSEPNDGAPATHVPGSTIHTAMNGPGTAINPTTDKDTTPPTISPSQAMQQLPPSTTSDQAPNSGSSGNNTETTDCTTAPSNPRLERAVAESQQKK
ncbi:hypothetical protein EI94DRAFT_1697456 [Lactarius quietus]|nr:hypothetical protein EI94DRAFT_1697456 [Lactarius quietus]